MFKSSKGIFVAVIVAAVIIGIGGWKFPQISKSIDLHGGPGVSQEAREHILHGDKTGGGHLYGTGIACKTEFPKDWNEAAVIGNIKKIAANDNLPWKKEKNGYYTATDKVDGVKVRVVLDKERDDIVTAYPVSGKANACKPAAKTASVHKKARVIAPEKVETSAGATKSATMPNASNRQPRTQNFNSN